MREPANAEELALVRKAISLGETTRGCCEWNDRAAQRVRARPPCEGMTPEGVRQVLIGYVARDQGEIVQVKEKRAEYSERRFYYKAIIPVADFAEGLFVELVLTDADVDIPSVEIVNAHKQTR